LLLHANPGDSRDFEAVSAALADYGRVIALDWPGYGRCPLPHCTGEVAQLDQES
jgi:pimeloyl-ACP methyl ester carboxylesterase|tara:strand:+ start:16402 stop:16563 length:162 start_codon:yes stop_codon:yes gene_type:complete